MKICILKHRFWNPAMPGITLGVRDGADQLNLPERWSEATHVFVAPAYDLFTRAPSFISSVFGVMNRTDQHDFQISTSFPERPPEVPELNWTPNIWLGALIEGPREVVRLEALRKTQAGTKFAHFRGQAGLSANTDFTGLDFVIVEARNARSVPGLAGLERSCLEQAVRLFVGDDVTSSSDSRDATGRHYSPLRLDAEQVGNHQLWVPPRARLTDGGENGKR